ncbi:hypothetical protein IQ215_12595 [Cyanobacterium stanieri LEGE 03274]|uniref:Uncharacterized protein n=1 Tax=Cyanobacterium stanieri LEGE 03274 TaxID=1828756 RepID=A0ABR9V6M8_9CHRO|nr:hypothetical protein [Cyanobacterium stanieri]MBE9223535.1 hypothetical protein [Cyanobacterium stanieri LEGE 03274]
MLLSKHNPVKKYYFLATLTLSLSLWGIITFPGHSEERQEEILFQTKANLVINKLAQSQKIPSEGDFEKYAFPSIIAHLEKNIDPDWTTSQIERFTNRSPESFYINREAFASPGITRIIYKYNNNEQVKKGKNQYLDFIFHPQRLNTNYNFWDTGGTENFVNMIRTSGYLLSLKTENSQYPRAKEKQQKTENWIRQKAQTTYRVGTAEWDSSTYTIYNIIGWLNIYDFAEDEEIKKIAQAMLDYYSSVMALKYSDGVYGGAEQRGGGAIKSFQSETDFLNWFWFSHYIPEDESFFNWPQYLPLIHAVTSSYRPPQEALELARKNINLPTYYHNYKATYDFSNVNIPEFFYIANSYTLGSVIVSSGEQVVSWKLVSFSENNQSTKVITGANSFYNRSKNGVGKTTFDYYSQYENVLLQKTVVPEIVKRDFQRQTLRTFIDTLLIGIKCGNTCQSLLAQKLQNLIPQSNYPIKKINGQYKIGNYVSFPSDTIIQERNNIFFLNANQTYLAIFPLNQDAEIISLENSSRSYLQSLSNLDNPAGFLLVAEDSSNYDNFNVFQNDIINKSQLNLDELDNGIIEFVSPNHSFLTFITNHSSDIPKILVNNQLQKNNINQGILYGGNNLNIKDRILTIEGQTSTYEINYQNNLPIFTRTYKQ